MLEALGKLAAQFVKSITGQTKTVEVTKGEGYTDFTFILSVDTVQGIERLRQDFGGKTRPEVICMALALLKIATAAERERGQVVIIMPEGTCYPIDLGCFVNKPLK